VATSREPDWFDDRIVLNPVTVRKTRHNGKVAHLFVEYTNGAISDHARSFCDITQWPNTRNAYSNWADAAPGVPLCNHCGRAFHKRRKNWRGQP